MWYLVYFRSRIFTFDSKWAVVRLDEGRKFMPDYDPLLDIENYVTGIAVNAEEPNDVDQMVDRLKAKLPLNFRTWKDTNKALIFALQLEKIYDGRHSYADCPGCCFLSRGTMMMTVFHKKLRFACCVPSV